MGTNNAINLNSTGIIGYDGSSTFNGSTVTQHSLLLGGANNHTINNLGVATNGQLPIGSAGADPVLATLTAGTGVGIANAAGSITISVIGGGLTWSVVTSDVSPTVKNNGYVANKSGTVNFTMPATSAVGELFAFVNLNTTTGTNINYGSGQNIIFGSSTTTTTSGGLTSTKVGDVVYLLTVVANTTWLATNSIGNWTIN